MERDVSTLDHSNVRGGWRLALWLGCLVWFVGLGQPAAVAAERLHTVQPGQTWSAIAKRYRVGVWDLAAANRTTPQRRLRAGQELMVPPRGVTYVRRGQTLSHIARRNGCTVADLQRLNRLGKRTSLREGKRLMLPGYDPGVRRKRDWGKPAQPGTVRIRRGEDEATIALVDEAGHVRMEGLEALAVLMRHPGETGEGLPHPRLARLLAAISDHFGGRPVHLVSGFREAGGYTSDGSRHVQGRAADISVAGVPRRTLFEFCRSLKDTGCGYYPRSVFVHVDAREHSAQWVDWSRPGKRPRYGTLRRPYRRRELRRPRTRPRVGRRVTRPDAVPVRVEVVDAEGRTVWFVDDRG